MTNVSADTLTKPPNVSVKTTPTPSITVAVGPKGSNGSGSPGPPGPPGPAGPVGPPGPSAVSANAPNLAKLGTDNLILVPDSPSDGNFYARRSGTWDGLNDTYMRWVPYTGVVGQAYLNQDLTRDGDWTMVANKDTTTRPAPQPSGAEEDLLPAWTPATNSARATYTVYNEWTVNTAGWIDQYGGDVLTQNLNATHTVTLQVGGVVKDTFTSAPINAALYWHNITPLLVAAGSVVRVTVKVTLVANNLMYWLQQAALFATPPVYCSLAVGSKDGAAVGTTAYGCHVQFIPGAFSPDWDVVAYGGAAAEGGGGVADAPIDGNTYGRLNAAWTPALPVAGGTLTGALTLNADPAVALGAATKQYVDTHDPVASTTAPLMDGAASAGTQNAWSHGDHIHPTDASRAPTASPTFTGTVTLPADPATALQAATKQYVDAHAGGLPLTGGTITGRLVVNDPTANWGGINHNLDLTGVNSTLTLGPTAQLRFGFQWYGTSLWVSSWNPDGSGEFDFMQIGAGRVSIRTTLSMSNQAITNLLDPVSPQDGATKNYVDTHVAAANTVATLPAAPVLGQRNFVSDATVTTFASAVAGGGTNKVPVYYDGASWKIG